MRDTKSWIPALEAARIAECHPTYFNAVVNKGAIESKRVAGRVLVERRSFEAWLELYRVRRHRQPEPEAAPAPARRFY